MTVGEKEALIVEMVTWYELRDFFSEEIEDSVPDEPETEAYLHWERLYMKSSALIGQRLEELGLNKKGLNTRSKLWKTARDRYANGERCYKGPFPTASAFCSVTID